jgi:hypothetical protein
MPHPRQHNPKDTEKPGMRNLFFHESGSIRSFEELYKGRDCSMSVNSLPNFIAEIPIKQVISKINSTQQDNSSERPSDIMRTASISLFQTYATFSTENSINN